MSKQAFPVPTSPIVSEVCSRHLAPAELISVLGSLHETQLIPALAEGWDGPNGSEGLTAGREREREGGGLLEGVSQRSTDDCWSLRGARKGPEARRSAPKPGPYGTGLDIQLTSKIRCDVNLASHLSGGGPRGRTPAPVL
ncbi:hypothetical protein EYF80_023216 [Liparis tanakae]|uniref:Uncharacterized protein n=1 Tax=Liparis tanakae TaxID=230148 RepID=A0A4Z2HLU0_9TELE|nr:hypothetical protein EYF80_023216 [Liparis tanakae]